MTSLSIVARRTGVVSKMIPGRVGEKHRRFANMNIRVLGTHYPCSRLPVFTARKRGYCVPTLTQRSVWCYRVPTRFYTAYPFT